jgi:hypothetical protein
MAARGGRARATNVASAHSPWLGEWCPFTCPCATMGEPERARALVELEALRRALHNAALSTSMGACLGTLNLLTQLSLAREQLGRIADLVRRARCDGTRPMPRLDLDVALLRSDAAASVANDLQDALRRACALVALATAEAETLDGFARPRSELDQSVARALEHLTEAQATQHEHLNALATAA